MIFIIKKDNLLTLQFSSPSLLSARLAGADEPEEGLCLTAFGFEDWRHSHAFHQICGFWFVGCRDSTAKGYRGFAATDEMYPGHFTPDQIVDGSLAGLYEKLA